MERFDIVLPKRSHPHLRCMRLSVCAAILMGLVLAAQSSLAFELDYAVQPRAVNLGEPVRVSFTLRGISQPPAPNLAGIDGFRVANQGRPQVSQNTVIVDGRMSTDITFTYTLVPEREGTLTIGPINYTAQGQTKLLPQVTVQVAPAHQEAALFARMTVERSEVYLHEIFEVTLTIYSHQVDLGSDFRLLNMPDARLSFQTFNEMHSEPEMVNGRVYRTKRFQSEVRGIAAGEYTLAPSLSVPVVRQTQRRSAFDLFFSGAQVDHTEVPVEPITITVRPLPSEGRPDSFTGAVGGFDFAVSAQPMEVDAGDPISLTMRIEGRGNMDAVSAPRIDFGPDFRVYDAQLQQRDLNQRRSRGRIEFEQVIIPRSDHIEAIPPIAFTFFDPAQGTYRTVERGPFPIRVRPAPTPDTPLALPPPSPVTPELTVLHQDIVYLKSAPDAWPRLGRRPWYMRPFYVGVQVLPALALAGSLMMARRREELSRDIAKARRLRAPRAARAAVGRAETALRAGQPALFHEAVWEALHSFFGDLFNLQPGEVDPDGVVQRLRAAQIEEGQIESVASLFRQCELARFASGAVPGDSQSLAETLEQLQAVFRSCGKVSS